MQVLDIETCIPLLLQPVEAGNRLKRLVLIGDHNQLPPIVQNMTLQKYALFALLPICHYLFLSLCYVRSCLALCSAPIILPFAC